jgi:hypothetical protein
MDAKFLENGRMVNLVHIIDKGFLVQDVWNYGDEEDPEFGYDDRIYFVEKVYDAAPTEAWDSRINQLNNQIREKEDGLLELEEKVRKIKNSEAARLKRYKQYEQLQRLDDFLDGKLTHFIRKDYYEIHAIGDKETRDQYSRDEIKLISLFGDSKGNLMWKINMYADGSGGGWNEIIPCCSYDDALEKLQKFINETTTQNIWKAELCVNAAKKYNLFVDPALVKAVADNKKQNVIDKITDLEEKLLKQRNELKKLQEEEG